MIDAFELKRKGYYKQAIELYYKVMSTEGDDIEILAGLPQKWYDAQLNDFRDYLTKEKGLIHFKFEGETYNIRIVGTKIFEQGYAAFMTSDNAEKYFDSEVCVVDIGGGTMDIIPVVNGNMQFDSCKIDKRAALWLVGSIQEKLETELYHTVSDETIIKYMIDGNVELPCKNKYEEIMKRELVKYCKQVYTILAQHRINTELIPIIFVGGGSVILKNFNTCNPNNKDEYITDIRANAKGFKKIESYL